MSGNKNQLLGGGQQAPTPPKTKSDPTSVDDVRSLEPIGLTGDVPVYSPRGFHLFPSAQGKKTILKQLEGLESPLEIPKENQVQSFVGQLGNNLLEFPQSGELVPKIPKP